MVAVVRTICMQSSGPSTYMWVSSPPSPRHTGLSVCRLNTPSRNFSGLVWCYYSDDIVSIYAHLRSYYNNDIMWRCEWCNVCKSMLVVTFWFWFLFLCLALNPSYGPTLREKEKLLQSNRLPHMYKQECINFQAESCQGFAPVSYHVCPAQNILTHAGNK